MRQECNTADVTAHSLHQSHRHRFHPLTVRVCRTEMKTIKQLWHQGGWGGGRWSPLICVRWPPGTVTLLPENRQVIYYMTGSTETDHHLRTWAANKWGTPKTLIHEGYKVIFLLTVWRLQIVMELCKNKPHYAERSVYLLSTQQGMSCVTLIASSPAEL